MLFPRNALTSGPQARFFAEEPIAKVKMGKLKTPSRVSGFELSRKGFPR